MAIPAIGQSVRFKSKELRSSERALGWIGGVKSLARVHRSASLVLPYHSRPSQDSKRVFSLIRPRDPARRSITCARPRRLKRLTSSLFGRPGTKLCSRVLRGRAKVSLCCGLELRARQAVFRDPISYSTKPTIARLSGCSVSALNAERLHGVCSAARRLYALSILRLVTRGRLLRLVASRGGQTALYTH